MRGGRIVTDLEEIATVAALTHDAEGIVREGKAAFVAGALPGEKIRFKRTRRHRQHDDAELLEVLEPAAGRVAPRCAHFGVCGGCALQHLSADAQLDIKQTELRDNLERVAKVTPREWLEPLRGPVWNYRRRARLGAKFVTKKDRVVVGFRERLAPYVAEVQRCEVLTHPVAELVAPLAGMLNTLSIRHRIPQVEAAVADNVTALVLRVLDTPSADDLEKLRAFARERSVRFYLQAGGLESVTPLEPGGAAPGEVATGGTPPGGAVPGGAAPGEVATGGAAPGGAASGGAASGGALEPLRYGLPRFDLQLEFLPTDFVQINAQINEALVGRAVELLGLTPQSSVLDLFCGLGNFTLALARSAGRAVGVEGEKGLVERARHNAGLNRITNAEFHLADLSQPLDPSLPWLKGSYTHVLLDPPRAGASEVLGSIVRLNPQRVLYISCHPGSLARDLGLLVHEHGMSLVAAGVLDMFPHTTHVESMAILEPGRKSGKRKGGAAP